MRDSSEQRTDPFDGLEWRNVTSLLSVLRECEYTKTEHIRKRYAQGASHFPETISFLSMLDAVREKEGHLLPSAALTTATPSGDQSWVLVRLFAKQNRYRTEIARYLRRFRVVDGQLVHRPVPQSRHRHSHVRNFLMEMGVVGHDSARDFYRIEPGHLDAYIMARPDAGKKSPLALGASLHDKTAIGTAAEEAVMSYERKRVGAAFASCVEHIALRNVAAGYDIRSVTIDAGFAPQPRYIEVKAVSGSTLQFHWTRNEVLTAEVFRSWYFLYLVPVETGGCFALGDLRIVQDPHATILKQASDWAVEPDVLRCFRQGEGFHAREVSGNDR